MHNVTKNLADGSSDEGIMIIVVETVVDAENDVANEDIDEEPKCVDKVSFLPIASNAEMNESEENKQCRNSNSNRIENSSEIYFLLLFLSFTIITYCQLTCIDIPIQISKEYTEISEIPSLKWYKHVNKQIIKLLS